MGKKTNWTTAEDQTLCRVWMNANELQSQGGDQKSSNFWNLVLELFHEEVETPVERPLNGLKVRWTRINRDSQKFTSIFNGLQYKRMKQADQSGGESGDTKAMALLTEQPWIDDAKVIFRQIYKSKFSFEACWKQLRYSTKWMQLYSSTSNYPVLPINAVSATLTVAKAETVHADAAEAPSGRSNKPDTSVLEHGIKKSTSPSLLPSVTKSALPSDETSSSPVAAVASTQAPESRAFILSSRKRRFNAPLESCAEVSHQKQFHGITSALVDELKRQNDLMEDQNAIALLTINSEMISDADTRQSYLLLRNRYLKKARNDSRTSTVV